MQLVGIIPAAGGATRLQPLESSKEVYPIGGKPVLLYLLERMRIAGASRVRVVTRPEKEDVIALAREEGLEVVLGEPASVADSVASGLAGLERDDLVLFGFPDTIWEPSDGFLQLLQRFEEGGCAVLLGLFECTEPERCDIVEVDDEGRVREIAVKPASPRSRLTWGCAAARVRDLRGMRGWTEPGDYFASLGANGAVRGLYLSNSYVDIGTPAALREAAGLRTMRTAERTDLRR